MSHYARRAATLALLLAIPLQASAQPRSCLTRPEAEAVLLTVAPDALTSVGIVCAAALPSDALIRRPGALLDRLRAGSNAAWPRAQDAIRKLAGEEIGSLLGTDAARPILSALVAPLIATQVKPDDCARIDRIMTALAPLPPRNIATLIVEFIGVAQDKRRPGGKFPLALCPAP